MSHTHINLNYHIVFSTRMREPNIIKLIQPQLWTYLGGIVRAEGGVSIEIGGVQDHVHLLVSLHQNQTIADFMRKLKAGSSKWLHDTFPDNPIWWQNGYGAFSVSNSLIENVKHYILNQEAHHSKVSYQDEYLALLNWHEVGFVETELWK